MRSPEPRNWNLRSDLSNSGADKRAGGSPLRLVDRLRNAKGEAEFTKLLPKATHFTIERSQSSLMISQVIAGRHDGRRRGGRSRDIRRDVADANCPTSKRSDLSVLQPSVSRPTRRETPSSGSTGSLAIKSHAQPTEIANGATECRFRWQKCSAF